MEVLTYESLREIQRNEKKSEKLFELEEDFFESIQKYFEQRENSKDNGSVIELENAKTILRDIVDRRERKILNQALRATRTHEKVDTSAMTDSEKKLFDELIVTLKKYRIDIIGEAEVEPEPEETEEEADLVKVKILEDLPAIVGSDFEDYGPFKEGDVVDLPPENAEIFISKAKAEKVEQ
jgi:DNA replication initiation complex subunit (GINS family)